MSNDNKPSSTTRTDALIERHRAETRQLYVDHPTLPSEVLAPHAQRQTKELIEHTYSLEHELAEQARKERAICTRCLQYIDSVDAARE
jgi:hypothetical protein